jgi:hypothetical protein
MTDEIEFQNQPQLPKPSSALQRLDKLIGTWEISGGAGGKVTYEWMEGEYFLLQHVDLEQNGMRIMGVEIIGHERKFGEEPSEHIKSRFYDNLGDTFDYVYELDSDTLTIWAGEKGSPAFYQGRFSDNGNVLSGTWVYPDGGGYTSTAVRVRR